MSESCEWKNLKGFIKMFKPGCRKGRPVITGESEIDDVKFCPYCGKSLVVKDE